MQLGFGRARTAVFYSASSSPVVPNLLAEGSQIQTYDFVREPHKRNFISQLIRCFRAEQARNQLGSPGGAKSFLRGAQIFWTVSNNFKRCQYIFPGGKKFSRGTSPPLRHPWLRAWSRTKSITQNILEVVLKDCWRPHKRAWEPHAALRTVVENHWSNQLLWAICFVNGTCKWWYVK